MTVSTAPQDTLKAELIALGDLKVWSVLVTIFGDLAPLGSDHIPGPALSALTGQMGIKPAALRVAIHRLKKDGWIETAKQGRVSQYRLSAHGRGETERARARIYGPAPAPRDWSLVIAQEPSPDAPPSDWLPLGRSTFVTQTAPEPDGLIVTQLGDHALPDWVLEKIMPTDQRQNFARLIEVLSNHPLSDAPEPVLQRLTLRILILHAWRRLILRQNPAALELLGPDWPGTECRNLVMAWLDALPRAPVGDLND